VKERFELELECQLDESIGWSKWEHVKDGKTSRVDRVRKKGSVQECVNELMDELSSLYHHIFVAEWQRKQLQCLKKSLPVGWALVFVDFSENFLCRLQDEVQSAHWGYKQISLFPAVVFRRCPAGCDEPRRDEICLVSDDDKRCPSHSDLFGQAGGRRGCLPVMAAQPSLNQSCHSFC
jgi:hypothetical protein